MFQTENDFKQIDICKQPYNFFNFKFLAQLSQQSQQYSLGLFFCEEIIKQENIIDEDLAELLDRSLKNIIEPLRKSLLTLDEIQSQELEEYQKDIIQEVRFDIQMDLTKVLNLKNFISLKLEKISKLENDFTILYLMKLHADFLRYSIEYTHGQIKYKLIRNCEKAYDLAYSFAKEKFPPIFHLRLGLVLNRAIFVKKHLKNQLEALKILQESIKQSEKYKERHNEQLKEKSQKIMKVIEFNQKDWDEKTTKEMVSNLNNKLK